ncbi:MAG: hypothetical protein FWE38_03625 [Firmicutes bacterium]|nr:hypothetical protein [Bacillota bacterium]
MDELAKALVEASVSVRKLIKLLGEHSVPHSYLRDISEELLFLKGYVQCMADRQKRVLDKAAD